VLDALGWPATVFVVTEFAESGRALQWPGIDEWAGGPHHDELEPLGWEELQGLADDGWEIGSHTASHPHLTTLADRELEAELEHPRRVIAERLGSCETIAYPYGDADARVAAAAARVGYLAGCTLPNALWPDEPHLRPRVGLYENDVGTRLWLKTARIPLAVRGSRPFATLLPRRWR
jgi:peptidoglycan/xylan/chitin deacetylase (PgdA/CDA1 family)